MSKIKQKTILSFFLGFVVIWFGIQEVTSPGHWVAFVPHFLGAGQTLVHLVVIHGVVLLAAGIALVFGIYRRFAAAVVTLMLLQIVVTLLFAEGLDEISVRDIGLFGAALALAWKD